MANDALNAKSKLFLFEITKENYFTKIIVDKSTFVQSLTFIFSEILAKDLPNKAKYETETSKAVLQIVNARKLYPKALTMRYENEEKFAKKQLRKKAVEANRESRKKAERRGSAVSISADVDQTLSYGDWKILEPGNFGSQVRKA